MNDTLDDSMGERKRTEVFAMLEAANEIYRNAFRKAVTEKEEAVQRR